MEICYFYNYTKRLGTAKTPVVNQTQPSVQGESTDKYLSSRITYIK